MLFSSFLQTIYKAKNNKLTKQEDFLIELFESADVYFPHSGDYSKKIFNGSKPLTSEIKYLLPKDTEHNGIADFFSKTINPLRFDELLADFEIDRHEKKDLPVFSEALALQFLNYMKYPEDQLPTTVKSIYEILLDQYGNGKIENSNEKALFAAKQHLYQAVTALNKIEVNKDILTLKGPFEAFFNFINKTYRAFESGCDLNGKKMYFGIRKEILSQEKNVSDYLLKITEMGALPIELLKEINIIVYDNYYFNDKELEVTIKLFDDDESDKILVKFKELKFYPVNEIFFSQYIKFKLADENEDLMGEVFNIASVTYQILNSIALNLDKKDSSDLIINKKIDQEFENLLGNIVQFIVDGTYFPQTGKIEYYPAIVPFVKVKDGFTQTGKDKFKWTKHPVFRGYPKNITFETKFTLLFNHLHKIWRIDQKYEDPMSELVTFNKDGTCRWFMVPVTSKARIYRLIRDVSKIVYSDRIEGFVFTSIVTSNYPDNKEAFVDLLKLTSAERIKIGQDELFGYGFFNEQTYTLTISKEDSIRGEKPHKIDVKEYGYLPIIRNIHILNKILDAK